MDYQKNLLKLFNFCTLKLKILQISNVIYAQTLKIFCYQSISLYCAKKKIRQWVDLEEKFVDMCVNSCEAFTEKKSEATSCSICKENWYNIQWKPHKVAVYFSLIPHIQMQYKDSTCVKQLMYQANYLNNPEKLGDIFDEKLYKEIVNEGLLPDLRDTHCLNCLSWLFHFLYWIRWFFWNT